MFYVLAVTAVAIIVEQILFEPTHGRYAWFAVSALVAALVTLLLARRAAWRGRWIAARYLAERIRSGVFLAATGAGDAPRSPSDTVGAGPDPNREWADRAFLEISCRAPSSPVAESEVPALRQLLLDSWINDQISYNEKAYFRLTQRQRQLNRVVVALFGIGVLMALLHSLGIAHLAKLTAYLAVVTPVIAAVFNSYIVQRDYGRLAERSRLMVVRLTEARRLVTESEQLSSLQAAARSTDLLMRSETDHSWDVVRFSDPELPV
jgi:hypothetical protein